MELVGTVRCGAQVAGGAGYTVHAVRWTVLDVWPDAFAFLHRHLGWPSPAKR